MAEISLRQKIEEKKAVIAVIGLGYVGLPLAVEFAKKGFLVIGIDLDKEKIEKINRGISYITDVSSEELKKVVMKERMVGFTDYSQISRAQIAIIAVPTPLSKRRKPDISFILKAAERIARYIRRETLVVLESTVYPGTTREIILPLLERSGLKVGKDFLLSFSPERVDPGNKRYKTGNIPKIVGGIDKKSTQLTRLLYQQIINKVIPVLSPEIAEMAKLWENTFRAVNIALANEMALVCNRLGIDVWEVISVAQTKPFGFLAFYPGPGLGGHCLPIDPLYLSYKAKLEGIETRLIQVADEINSQMPHYVLGRIEKILHRAGKRLSHSKVFILGITYKKDIPDIRESPAIEIIKLLIRRKAKVSYFDPFVKEIKIGKKVFHSSPLEKRVLQEQDCIAIITDHSLNYHLVVENASCILDTRNALAKIKGKIRTRIERL